MRESGARCPGCNVWFRITAAQLCAAGGLVRCGFCLTVFDAGAQDLPALAAPMPAPRLPDPDVEPPLGSSPDAGSTAAVADQETPDEPAAAADLSQPDPAGGERPAPDAVPDSEPAALAESGAAELQAGLESAMESEPELARAPEPALEVEPPPAPEAEPNALEFVPLSATEPDAPPACVSDPGEASAEATAANQTVADHEPHPRDPEPPASGDAAVFDAVQDAGSESGTSDSRAVPPWLHAARPASAGKRAPALVAVAALCALLLQGLYFHADLLAERPELQGFYRILCRAAPCQRPPYRDPAAIAVDQLAVRASGPGALRLDAMLTNRGRAAQPLPSVRLGFENLQGALIAARRFTPGEYLDQPPPAALAAGQSLHLVLELVDPGPDAVSYSLAPAD